VLASSGNGAHMRLTSGSGDSMDIIILGFACGFGLHILSSLLGYCIRELVKLFKLSNK